MSDSAERSPSWVWKHYPLSTRSHRDCHDATAKVPITSGRNLQPSEFRLHSSNPPTPGQVFGIINHDANPNQVRFGVGHQFYVPTTDDLAIVQELFPGIEPGNPSWTQIETALILGGIDKAELRKHNAATLIRFLQRYSAAAAGREAIETVTKTGQLDDPFAFVDQHAKGKNLEIDTTPTLPRPPYALIEAAAIGIPDVLANVAPKHDGAIELIASHLAKRLHDAKHTAAAAQWAIHEAIQNGQLRAGFVEVEFPSWLPPGTNVWQGGGRGTIAIKKGKPVPFNAFKVIATPLLWTWWHMEVANRNSPTAAGQDKPMPNQDFDGVVQTTHDAAKKRSKNAPVNDHPPRTTRAKKRSTSRGEGRAKLIAALTKHHQYAEGGCLNQEPIGNNELATKAGVSASTASAFFNEIFQGHAAYRGVCRHAGRLADSLKVLNGEFSPHELYGRRPANEDDRSDETEE